MRKQDEDLNVKPEALLWLDFETTGTDRDDSLPLEVGMECTDVLGEHSYGSLHRIIRPDYLDLLGISQVVFSMHTDNGLLFELLNGSPQDDCANAVSNAVEEYLDSLSQRFTLVPAGTNVDFDLDFLKSLDLDPDAWLSYRKFDLTTLRRYIRFLDCPEDSVQGACRFAQGARLHTTRHQRLQVVPQASEGSMVMTVAAMMLLCAAVLVAWIGGRL